MKVIVAMQQSLATTAGVLEPLSVPDLAEDTLRVEGAALERLGIEVERRFGAVPIVTTQRHKILDILINLVSNARHAVAELDGPRGMSSPSLTRATTFAARSPTTASESRPRTRRASSAAASRRAKTVTASACTAARSRPRSWAAP